MSLVAILVIFFNVSITILWIWALIDWYKNESHSSNDSIAWLLVIIFGGFIGAMIYRYIRIPYRENAKRKKMYT
jgi:hypothetical protein